MNDTTPSPRSKFGIVREREDGHVLVLFERQLAHPAGRVWAAMTDPEIRKVWLPGFEFENRQGGECQIWFGGDCDGPSHVQCKVEVFDPPHHLRLGTIDMVLDTTDTGCVLRFSDILWFDDRPRDQFANSVLGGWHRFLDKMEHFLDTGKPEHPEPAEPDYASMDVPSRDALMR